MSPNAFSVYWASYCQLPGFSGTNVNGSLLSSHIHRESQGEIGVIVVSGFWALAVGHHHRCPTCLLTVEKYLSILPLFLCLSLSVSLAMGDSLPCQTTTPQFENH